MGSQEHKRDEELLIHADKDACVECWGCVRYCPAKAIRVVERRTEVIPEKCVACGLCVYECAHGGHVVRDDTSRVWELLESGRPVVAVLASEFVPAMHPMRPVEVERALEALGFYATESTVLGEEMLAIAYAGFAKREAAFPVLRSTCPVAVDWVRKYHPALVQALAPLVPPYVAQARLVRELYPPETAVVYVGPCYSRKDEVRDASFGAAVDVAIDFLELKRMIASGRRPKGAPILREAHHGRRPWPMKELSLTDGFPRDVLATRTPLDTDVVVARGLRAIEAAVNAIERGESAPLILDMLFCEGCIDGPAVNPGMSLSAKRNVESAERELQTPSVIGSRNLLRHLPHVDLVRSFRARPVAVPEPSEEEVDRVLADGGFASRADTIDCGACGWRTCVDHAKAIHRGDSSWDLCFPLQRRLLESKVAALQEEERPLDESTGLWGRRAFAERLTDEVRRFERYASPVSLLLLRIDGLGGPEPRYGDAAEELLATVGAHLRAILRVTDMPARYDAERLAVILPGVNKTAAFAAAEKVRQSIAALGPSVGDDGYRERVYVTVSVGVAAVSESLADAALLVEAAEGALLSAEELGGDQVRLS